ncbi:hypothetical protein LCGC14_0895070 [marine sediment metagenome]|uniref:YnhF family membrane protein n=1 Tax=marine sediment metagenome TaxID=412755 RepID=A0A0F9PIX1_9ZZZZ
MSNKDAFSLGLMTGALLILAVFVVSMVTS